MSEAIEKFRQAVEKACSCKARHLRSRVITEGFEGDHIWDGVVEVFELDGHPRAKRCYAFLLVEDGKAVIKTVMGVSQVNSALSAVRMAIAGNAQEK